MRTHIQLVGGSISHYTSYSLQNVSHCTVVLSATVTSHVLVYCIMVGLHVVMDVTIYMYSQPLY